MVNSRNKNKNKILNPVTGRMINAEEAKSFGLINHIVKKEKLIGKGFMPD